MSEPTITFSDDPKDYRSILAFYYTPEGELAAKIKEGVTWEHHDTPPKVSKDEWCSVSSLEKKHSRHESVIKAELKDLLNQLSDILVKDGAVAAEDASDFIENYFFGQKKNRNNGLFVSGFGEQLWQDWRNVVPQVSLARSTSDIPLSELVMRYKSIPKNITKELKELSAIIIGDLEEFGGLNHNQAQSFVKQNLFGLRAAESGQPALCVTDPAGLNLWLRYRQIKYGKTPLLEGGKTASQAVDEYVGNSENLKKMFGRLREELIELAVTNGNLTVDRSDGNKQTIGISDYGHAVDAVEEHFVGMRQPSYKTPTLAATPQGRVLLEQAEYAPLRRDRCFPAKSEDEFTAHELKEKLIVSLERLSSLFQQLQKEYVKEQAKAGISEDVALKKIQSDFVVRRTMPCGRTVTCVTEKGLEELVKRYGLEERGQKEERNSGVDLANCWSDVVSSSPSSRAR